MFFMCVRQQVYARITFICMLTNIYKNYFENSQNKSNFIFIYIEKKRFPFYSNRCLCVRA